MLLCRRELNAIYGTELAKTAIALARELFNAAFSAVWGALRS